MNSRTWLALLLSMAVWFGYLKFFTPPPPPIDATSGVSTTAPGSSGQTPQGSVSTGNTTTTQSVSSTNPFATSMARPVDSTLTVGFPVREVRFSKLGARPVSVILKNYRSLPDAKAPPMEILGPSSASSTFSTVFTDGALAPLSVAEYSAKVEETGVREFTASAGGAQLVKHFSVPEQGYFSDVVLTLRVPAGSKREWGQLIIPLGAVSPEYDANDPMKAWEVVAYQADKLTRETVDSLDDGEKSMQGNTSWVAYGHRYFALAAIHKEGINPDVVFRKGPEFTGVALRYPIILKEGQNELTFKLQYYAGPKDIGALAAVPTMRGLVDYTFKAVAIPLLEILRFFYKYSHNYGIAIILLTLLVRILFYPLSLKSFRSMRNMQKLQPQLAALKEKYKDDREKFSREQLALFKAHKVNPAGGCLPIFIQLPVFIALYAVLQNSIELFQAPFFGWIHDLSAKDPFYVFPILMGVAMLIQQKMTPAVGMDPMQQKIMLIMPVVFTFLMVNLPSGLTVYMFVSTLLGILQQLMMTRESKKHEAAAVVVSPSPRIPEKT